MYLNVSMIMQIVGTKFSIFQNPSSSVIEAVVAGISERSTEKKVMCGFLRIPA